MPSFAIEVPGEANPLTETLLVHSLQSASSSDPTHIQTGTKQLQQWEKSPGYYKQLQSAYLDRRLPVELRYLAIIQLKNGIDRYWRKTAANAVSKGDKDAIRSRLLDSVVHESDDRLALQNALVIAKIARFEYPQDWPDAISSIIGTLRSASHIPPLQLARTLLVLLHVVKELSTARLQRSRQNLQAATPEVVHVLIGLYEDAVSFWLPALQTVPGQPEMSGALRLSLLAIKVLRRMLISGYEHPNRDGEIASFWLVTQKYLRSFMELRDSSPSEQLSLVDKNMLQLAKLHYEMSRDHPAAFVLLPNTPELIRAYWSVTSEFGQTIGSHGAVNGAAAAARIGTDGDEDVKPTKEKMALKGLLVVRACVKMAHNPAQTFKHRAPKDKEEKTHATTIVAQHVLTSDFVQQIMEILVTRFFVFRTSDLREWEEEPEEWEKREEGDGEDWEFSIRSCSEKLFLDLAINYKDMLIQPLLRVFYSVANTTNEDVLFKDSVYTAIGLAAPVLHDQLDFDTFIRDVLTAEVQKQKPGFGIIRRRAAIILGQWISVRVSQDSRPHVYAVFQHLLDKTDSLNDEVVRVTAGRQFSKIVDDWESRAEQLVPYADTILTRLMLLIEEVELTETKMALLNTISVIVERLEHRISPFAERIVSLLPQLWDASGEEHLMKQAILTILARLVNAMNAESLPLHAMVFPIIKGAVEPGSDTQVYLLDDAMDLWAAILVQTPEPASKEVLQLLPYLFSVYETGSANLLKALEITESYVLLAPTYVLFNETRFSLMTALANLLGTLRPDANGLVCNLLEVLIRAAQNLGGEQAVNQLAMHLGDATALSKLLDGLNGSWRAHCTTGPLAKAPTVDGVIETDYFAVLARLILGSLGSLRSIEAAFSTPSASPTLGETMGWLLEEWFSHFENVGDPSRRKLMCLALTKLLETNQSWILVHLQSLMTVWTDVITELREGAEDVGASGDCLVYVRNGVTAETAPHGHEAPENVRQRALTYSDDVHTVALSAYVKRQLEQAVAIAGGEQRFQEEWLVNVDRDILGAFGRLGIM